ncbi:MAG: thioredoxin domain-containing protein, partial [Pyrinomonadaceae bacterium]
MTSAKTFLIAALFLAVTFAAWAQTPRRRGAARPVAPKPPVSQPSPVPVAQPSPSRAAKTPTRLATVNGQLITTADIDPQVAEAVEGLDEKLSDAQRRLLEMQINTLLLEAEAKKRNVRTQQLYEQEVTKRIVAPSEAEIRKFTEENKDQLGGLEPAAARAQVVAFLRSEREEAISAEFVKRLRASYPVVPGTDLNTPNLAPSAAVVTVGGRPVTAGLISERMKPISYRLRLAAYQLARNALDRTITDLLLLAEANRRNVPPEAIVRSEISEKVRQPTEAEIAKFYSENKASINGELGAVRNQLAGYLQEQEQKRLEGALAERLRKGVDIRILITEPVPPVQAISSDDDPARGDANAPVTIVEFTDFQCPACAAMHPVLEDVLKTYGDKVRFVVRDYPLNMHANARKAAEAANAAHAQGKFFEYAALLFKRQNALDVPSLKKYAAEIGLDRPRFDAELDRGTYAAEVRHDIDEGEIYGVESTPAIFINGVLLRTLSAEA